MIDLYDEQLHNQIEARRYVNENGSLPRDIQTDCTELSCYLCPMLTVSGECLWNLLPNEIQENIEKEEEQNKMIGRCKE